MVLLVTVVPPALLALDFLVRPRGEYRAVVHTSVARQHQITAASGERRQGREEVPGADRGHGKRVSRSPSLHQDLDHTLLSVQSL